ncbi:MAG: PilZ domain-containing protein, partial [Bauldia litoralis]
QRTEARLVQRLDVEYGDAGELRATLEDISSGGLQLTVPDALEQGQSLLIALSNADGDCLLELRARVVHQQPVGEGDFAMYRVGLKFEHPSEALREQTQALIHALAMAGARDMVALTAGDELAEVASDPA